MILYPLGPVMRQEDVQGLLELHQSEDVHLADVVRAAHAAVVKGGLLPVALQGDMNKT